MKKTFFAALAFLLSTSAFLCAGEPAEIEIIFDASRSMNESAGQATKLAAAKQALSTVASQIEPGSKVGLRIFGAKPVTGNVNEACLDSELVIPISLFDKGPMILEVAGITAHGPTPIGYSLELAANDFSPGEVKKTIILISDGEESCDKDPVGVIEALKAKGIDVVIHAIGFDVDTAARQQLTRLADMTGGTYTDAKSADELKAQLTEVAEKAKLLTIKRGGGDNILAAGAGTKIVFSSTQEFAKMIDGKEDGAGAMYPGQHVVFSFADGQGILLESFAVPIFEVENYNPGDFKLLGSFDSPEEGFFPIADIHAENKVYFDNVYQTFKIDPPTALRYLKVIVGGGSTGGHSYHTEWKAYGKYLTAGELEAARKAQASRPYNILAKEFGGKLIAASNIQFERLIDGTAGGQGEKAELYPDQEGIFGFKDGKTAMIESVAFPIFEAADNNCKVLEFWASTTTPTGEYTKIAALETTNMVFAGDPFQEYKLPEPMPVKFLKVVLKSTHGRSYCYARELHAIGTIEA